jgi:hypothetical protein
MSSLRRSLSAKIPRDIYKQEAEIESMFRNLARFGNNAGPRHSQDRPDDNPQQEVIAWIAVAVLAVLSIITGCLLWLKASGG